MCHHYPGLSGLTCTAYHYSSFSLRFILLILVLSFHINTSAQNIFANPGFEDINICTEYRATCAPEAWFYIKPTTNPLVNGKAAPRPLLGTNILLVPVHNVFDSKGTRPYVYTMLACPLIAGEKYKLSFYINTSKQKFYNLDFYFCDKEPATRYFSTTNISPTFSITANEIVAELKQGWQAVEYYFTATGNEQFCMLGNMSQPMDYKIEERMNSAGTVFYFLDEIKLTALNNKPLCDEYADHIKSMYDQDSRHTDYTLIEVAPQKPKPPVFVTDTINVPAAFFETNSALLKPSFKTIMDSLIMLLSTKKIAKMEVVGHTDNKGTPEKNRQLSLARATAVQHYFIDKLPQYAERIFVTGKGQDQPIADNATEQGRTKNRRVEIILTIIDQKK